MGLGHGGSLFMLLFFINFVRLPHTLLIQRSFGERSEGFIVPNEDNGSLSPWTELDRFPKVAAITTQTRKAQFPLCLAHKGEVGNVTWGFEGLTLHP